MGLLGRKKAVESVPMEGFCQRIREAEPCFQGFNDPYLLRMMLAGIERFEEADRDPHAIADAALAHTSADFVLEAMQGAVRIIAGAANAGLTSDDLKRALAAR